MRWAARGASVLGLLALGGCSSPSEVMIAVSTDLSLPQDIDTIRVRVKSGGNEKLQRPFADLGREGAEALLPFTLGLVAEEPGVEIHVSVVALAGATPRILREAVTTIPSERVALLHLPLHFLCDGSAKQGTPTLEDPSPVENARCGEGETCVAGRCAAVEVDSATLSDYAPEDVFGRSIGQGDGACFDVARCFANAPGFTLLDEDGGCSFVKVQGPENAALPVNVALKTASQAGVRGICGASGCFVALDAGSEAGFREGDDGVVRLPPEVCRQKAEGTVLEVVSQPAGEGCPQKVQSLPTCGPWSVAGGG